MQVLVRGHGLGLSSELLLSTQGAKSSVQVFQSPCAAADRPAIAMDRRLITNLSIASASSIRAGRSFDYTLSNEEPDLYKCHRGDREGTDTIYWMFFLADLGWVVVEAPKIVDGREPDKQWLSSVGERRFWCKHTAIREGWRRWTPWGDADEWDIHHSFPCLTTVTGRSPPIEGEDAAAIDGDITVFSPSDSDIDEITTADFQDTAHV